MWLIATGAFMACTWASKVNGILTVVAIGIAVLIDLWDILDVKKGHSMVSLISLVQSQLFTLAQEYFWKHFAARAMALIVLPIILYLAVFWVHLTVLTNSGPGDSFMSPHFQETLRNNEMLMNSQGLINPPSIRCIG